MTGYISVIPDGLYLMLMYNFNNVNFDSPTKKTVIDRHKALENHEMSYI